MAIFSCMDGIKRTLQNVFSSKLFKGKAILLYGPRQCGKTTLVKQLIDANGLTPVFLNGDDDQDVNIFQTVTASRWAQILGNKKAIFIDEGQKIPNLGRAVKLLIDSQPDIQVIITGSSSFALANSMEEPLTGRKFSYKLFPLSYGELSSHFGYLEELKNLELRLIYGSYPEVTLSGPEMKNTIKSIAESYLYRDLMQYEGIRKPALLEKLLKALAHQCGSEVSTTELAGLIGVSRTLVDSYLKILEQAFIVFPLNSYSTNQRNEIKKGVKYYFYDNGVRNAVLNDFTPISVRKDVGSLWENYLVSERFKRNSYNKSDGLPYFWRTSDQMEVDYIEVTGSKIEAFEFKWNPQKKSRITKAFTNRYPDAVIKTITPDNYDAFLGE